jgi:hypothetical protein
LNIEKLIHSTTPILTWFFNSTWSDYMIILSKIVIPAWTTGVQAPWMDLSLPFMALDTRFPVGMTGFV